MITRPIENCYWVVPGKLLAGEYPRNGDVESSRTKFAALTEAGVSVFIDLTAEGGLLPYAQWLEAETHQRFPVVDGWVPESPELTAAAEDLHRGSCATLFPFDGLFADDATSIGWGSSTLLPSPIFHRLLTMAGARIPANGVNHARSGVSGH